MPTSQSTTQITPRPHQLEAVEAARTLYLEHGAERAQLRMACGTGKTLTGAWLAQRMSARTVAVFEPSIALVAQTISQWQASGVPVRAMAVCSDPTTRSGREEIGTDGIDPYHGIHDGEGVTTHAMALARFIDRRPDAPNEIILIVSTYHSAPLVAEALRGARRRLDLMIADEAHHLAGRVDRRFRTVLDSNAIPAKHRLFQTATPIKLGNLARSVESIDEFTGATEHLRSMDDPKLFGSTAYTLSVGDGIDRGLLADYRVVVGAHRSGALDQSSQAGAALAVLADAVGEFGIRRVLTFHNRISSARTFAAGLNKLADLSGVPVQAFAVDGSMPDADRRAILDKLSPDSSTSSQVTVISSARCLGEGIDIPAVDAVLFADPRASGVSIMQAIGRVLRTFPGKAFGNILVPVILPADSDDQDELATSAYSDVWRVLRALRAHDDRVALDLDKARVWMGAHRGHVDPDTVPWLVVRGDEAPAPVIARLLERTSRAWEMFYGLLMSTASERGGATHIPSTTTVDGRNLGQWIVTQRVLYARGLMAPERGRRLEAVPGWTWSALSAADWRSLAKLDRVVAKHGSLTENPAGKSIYAGFTDGLNRPLNRWVATKIFEYWDEQLDEALAAELERRPGWTWHPLAEHDEAGLRAFRDFVGWEGHADVPADHIEDDQPLGQWLSDVRRRKVFGTLTPTLETMLFAAAPLDPDTGERQFAWRTPETWWAVAMQSASQYVAREKTIANLPVGHCELVDGREFNLYTWTRRIRFVHKRNQLEPERVAQVEAIPGWSWTGGRRQLVIGDPIDLGPTPHGRRGAAKGCPCKVCIDEYRACASAHSRGRREKHRRDWVEAKDAAAHLKQLIDTETASDRSDRLITIGAIAAAAAISTGVVRGLLAGTITRCHPLHRRILLALTVDDVLAVRSVVRSRGRRGIEGHREMVDPAPTWELVDDLLGRGWTLPAISAGLGYNRTSTLPFTRERVSAPHAKMMRLFYDSLDPELTPPHLEPTRRRRPNGAAVNIHDATAETWAKDLLEQGYQVRHAAKLTGLSVPIVSSIETTLASARRAA